MSNEPSEDRIKAAQIRLNSLEKMHEHAEDPGSATLFIWGFSALSFVGTFVGLRQIVRSGDVPDGAFGSFVTDAVLFILVLLATLAMVHYLRAFLRKPFGKGALFLPVYIVLLIFSVTFGFTFYWKYMEAQRQSIDVAVERLEEFVSEIETAASGIGSTIILLDNLSTEFETLAETERTSGGTCGDSSPPGPGPRMRHRMRRAGEMDQQVERLQARFDVFTPSIQELRDYLPQVEELREEPSQQQPLEPETSETGEPLDAATAEPTNIEISDVERRERVFAEARRRAFAASAEINALAQDQSILSVSNQFRAWADEYNTRGLRRRDDPNGTVYECFSPPAANELYTASNALNNLPSVRVPTLPSFGGAAGTREAVDRMLGSLGTLWPFGGGNRDAEARDAITSTVTTSTLEPSTEAGVRNTAGAAARNGTSRNTQPTDRVVEEALPRLTPRDRFPLSVALVVDVLLFFSAIAESFSRSQRARKLEKLHQFHTDELNPYHVPLLVEQLDEEGRFGLINEYRFVVDRDDFFFAPPPSKDDNAHKIRDILRAWLASDYARQVPYDIEDLKRRLITENMPDHAELFDFGEDDLPRDYSPLVVMLDREKANEALIHALYIGDMPDPRAADAGPSVKRRKGQGIATAIATLLTAISIRIEKSVNGLADRVAGDDEKISNPEDYRANGIDPDGSANAGNGPERNQPSS
ncbi:MAG: hypothetical protein AAFQ22_01450 [Pseudomonadota bacterium]